VGPGRSSSGPCFICCYHLRAGDYGDGLPQPFATITDRAGGSVSIPPALVCARGPGPMPHASLAHDALLCTHKPPIIPRGGPTSPGTLGPSGPGQWALRVTFPVPRSRKFA
jgi:hypothetical protein